jgi:flagellar basal-body rod modification protein FlgD
MDSALQTRLTPPVTSKGRTYSDAKVENPPAAIDDATGAAQKKTSFRDLLMNSNEDVQKKHVAMKNGDGLAGAKTDEEFAKIMTDRANKDNLRKPQNDLDKDAFLKLFVTQMQNQDPLKPDDSSQMAAQLAQFNGLEQMLNVNKNLEKMQTEQALGRNLGLISFVGKDVRLDGGKLRFEDGKVTDSTFNMEKDAPKVTLEVRDPAGVIVGTKDLGYMKQGEHKVDWDGVGKDGKKIAGGIYTFSISAKDLNDQDMPVKITSNVRINGVDLHDSGGSFFTDLGKVRISEVSSVGDPGFAAKAKKDADVKKVAPDPTKAVQPLIGGDLGAAEAQPGPVTPPLPGPEVAPSQAAVPPVSMPPGLAAAPHDAAPMRNGATTGGAIEIPVPAGMIGGGSHGS